MRTLSLLFLTAAVCTAAVTPPEQIKVPAGFKVELLREAGPGEGSWICMAQDEQGRLYLSSQNGSFVKDGEWGGIWRVTLATNAAGEAQNSKLKAQGPQPATGAQPGEIRNPQSAIRNFEKVRVPISDAMGMLWAFDSLYVSGMGPQGRGIYRCTSSKRDGNLDTATLFKAIPGGAGEHGAHAIVLGPDRKLYVINGNSTGILDGLAPDSPYRHWGEDDLLPRLKDPVATFFDKIKAPYGCVYRTDADGTKWELFAGGFRNPYDIAFNPDGELFTYDSDMEWDRGLPWYRPTRILHVVPGGEYGFREGSAKWPAYFPDSLPAAADIGVGCPTGMKFGTEAKGWPEKYRRALFLHDWTYGRILAVNLHEKGASYTARNDLASYTYPRDAEANGDVEVFLSGKGMPVTDLEFLRDGSMVFTVGGRGTAAALYWVSYLENAAKPEGGASGRAGFQPAAPGILPGATDVARSPQQDAPSPANPPDASRADGRKPTTDGPGKIPGPAGYKPALPARGRLADADANRNTSRIANAPEAQRKLAGGAASEASATTGSPSAKASAPDGAQEVSPQEARRYRAKYEAMIGSADNRQKPFYDHTAGGVRIGEAMARIGDRFYMSAWRHSREAYPWEVLTQHANPEFIHELLRSEVKGLNLMIGGEILVQTRLAPPEEQITILAMLALFPLATLNDDLKLDKLRVLELSFARQGRPSEEWVKAVMEELLAHYPVPPIPANAATPARNPAAGAPVDAPAWRLNRELCALLTWLSNPELGALNADLAAAAGKQKTGAHEQNPGVHAQAAKVHEQTPEVHAQAAKVHEQTPEVHARRAKVHEQRPEVHAWTEKVHEQTPEVHEQKADFLGQNSPVSIPRAIAQSKVAENGGKIAFSGTVLLADAAPPAAKADPLPTEAPPSTSAQPREARTPSLNSQPSTLNPVPNPGADIFPGRKGAAFHAELGRQVIEKTLALMDAAPSQEEQVWYALCLRWAHGWTPELRVRYFRWFHEKAARYSGGNSFAKFVEAIRADAASRVPEADRAALADWLRPVASPVPAAALKPRAFVKAWTLPELEAALDKLKDRQPDLARGKELYTQAQCAQCHLFRDAGGNVGPDLTAVAQRFGRHDILESITDPSKVVSEQYAMVTLTVLDGKGGTREVSGLVKEDTSATITILTDPLAGTTANLYKNVVVKREKAAVSIMPPGLLNTLSAEEVADLLALFGVGANADAKPK